MSSYKATKQGADHKRVPDDVHNHPTIIGHEFSGEIIEVGSKWNTKFSRGQKFSIQPAMNYKNGPVGVQSAPGYSYKWIGGDATYIIIPNEVMEQNCLLPYNGDGYFPASLSEPMSCIVGAFKASYHTKPGSYVHEMGIKDRGIMAILAGVGPMGLGAIDLAIHGDRKPKLLVVTDIDDKRLQRAECLYTKEEAAKNGVELIYVNTGKTENPVDYLRGLTNGKGYDDVMVFAPVRPVIEQGDAILGFDGCLNFFAGPTDTQFKAEFNFYNVHYAYTHIVGTSGGNTEDMCDSLQLMSTGRINPAVMITHVGGLDAVIDTTKNLPDIPGGKKLIYTNINMPLTSLFQFAEKGKNNPVYAELNKIMEQNQFTWNVEAETVLLENADKL